MDADGHGYHAVAKTRRFTWQVKDKPVSQSVFIRVHPWLKTVLSNANYGNKDMHRADWRRVVAATLDRLGFRVHNGP